MSVMSRNVEICREMSDLSRNVRFVEKCRGQIEKSRGPKIYNVDLAEDLSQLKGDFDRPLGPPKI